MVQAQFDEVYEAIISSKIQLKNGRSVIDWIEFYLPMLKVYYQVGDEKAQLIMKHYFINKFSEQLEEAYAIFRNNSGYKARIRTLMSNGDRAFEWVRHNYDAILVMLEQGDYMAKYVLKQFNKVNEHIDFVAHNRKVQFDPMRLFFNRLGLYKKYLIENNAHPTDPSICFEGEGVSMQYWYTNNQYLIRIYAKKGNEDANFVYRDVKALSINDKMLEVLNYIRSNLVIPRYNSSACFSNGVKIGPWLTYEKKLIFKCYLNNNPIATALIQLLFELDPLYFDRIFDKRISNQAGNLKENYQYVRRAKRVDDKRD